MKKAGKIIMTVVLIFVLLIGIGFGYLYSHGMSGIGNTTKAQEDQIKIACVGDSITYGAHMQQQGSVFGDTYPAELLRLLEK